MSQTGPIAVRPILAAGKSDDRLVATSVKVRTLMSMGMDTVEIAKSYNTTEAAIWNALARAGA